MGLEEQCAQAMADRLVTIMNEKDRIKTCQLRDECGGQELPWWGKSLLP